MGGRGTTRSQDAAEYEGIASAADTPGQSVIRKLLECSVCSAGADTDERVTMKIAMPDMISNSYFPLLAAAGLGFFEAHNLDVSLHLMSPADKAYDALKQGHVDFVGAEAHAALAVFPSWKGMKLLCAQAQGMYWFLVMRSELGVRRGDVATVKGRRIGAAPWVELGLRRLLLAAGIDPLRDQVHITPIPGADNLEVNTGVTAARALETREIDGFWANGMGAELAVRRGIGTIVLDVRRGDGPRGCFEYTLATVAATDQLIENAPEKVAAVIRAIVAAQTALRKDVTLAATVGRKFFPAEEAKLIAEIVSRDLPFYDPSISEKTITAVNQFARDVGLLHDNPSYDDVVALQYRNLWRADNREINTT
jgi:NitT/TauT family transport system substrate-binding protein